MKGTKTHPQADRHRSTETETETVAACWAMRVLDRKISEDSDRETTRETGQQSARAEAARDKSGQGQKSHIAKCFFWRLCMRLWL